jgi:uncharacterized sulfatase
MDIFATLAELAARTGGFEKPNTHDGRSFAALLSDPKTKRDGRTLYFHYPHYYPTTSPASSIREGDWKLIEYFEDNRVELFNLAEDPVEARELSSAMPQRASELREKLHRWRAEVDAQMPTPNTAAAAAGG